MSYPGQSLGESVYSTAPADWTKFLLVFVFFYIFLYIILPEAIGLMSRVFANSPGDLGSILGRVTKDSKNGT